MNLPSSYSLLDTLKLVHLEIVRIAVPNRHRVLEHMQGHSAIVSGN